MKRLMLAVMGWFAMASCRTVRLANETMEMLYGLENVASATDDWFLIAPLGDFPHAEGIQRIDMDSVRTMANEFNSIPAKLKRAVSPGRPILEGHSDKYPEKYPNKRAQGWVTEVQAREDGLWGKAKWTPDGKALLENESYKFHSPYWKARRIGEEKGRPVFKPVVLASLALTNTPNLPIPALANEEDFSKENNKPQEKEMQLAALVALLGMANSATEQDVTTEITRLKTEAGKTTGLANEKTTAETSLANERAAKDKAIKQRNALVLDAAIAKGVITAAQRADYEIKLANDFESAQTELKEKKPAIKTQPRKDNDGARRTELGLANDETAIYERRQKVNALVKAKEKAGLSYDEAYREVKLENEALFSEMLEPDTNQED